MIKITILIILINVFYLIFIGWREIRHEQVIKDLSRLIKSKTSNEYQEYKYIDKPPKKPKEPTEEGVDLEQLKSEDLPDDL